MLAFAMPSSTFLQMRATVIGTQDVDTILVKEAISEVHEISVSKRGKKQKLRYEKEFHALANIAYFRNKCLTLGLASKVKVFRIRKWTIPKSNIRMKILNFFLNEMLC